MTDKKKPTVKGGKPAKKSSDKTAKSAAQKPAKGVIGRTVAMIKEELTKLGVQFKSKATKPELEDLLKKAEKTSVPAAKAAPVTRSRGGER